MTFNEFLLVCAVLGAIEAAAFLPKEVRKKFAKVRQKVEDAVALTERILHLIAIIKALARARLAILIVMPIIAAIMRLFP